MVVAGLAVGSFALWRRRKQPDETEGDRAGNGDDAGDAAGDTAQSGEKGDADQTVAAVSASHAPGESTSADS